MNWTPWPRDPRYLVGDDGSILNPESQPLPCPLDRDGYPLPYIRKPIGQRVGAHVIVCETFHGPRPPGMQVAHANGVRTDRHPSNLSWKTCAGNHADKREHGTDLIGVRNGRAVLNDDRVREIRALSATGIGARPLAARFGVSRATIRFIVQGATWRHVA
jgi:hypothetical protein